MKRRAAFLIILGLVSVLPQFSSAETIVLKSGYEIEGKITERTDDYISVDIAGVDVVYFLDEIERIDTQSQSPGAAQSEQGAALSQIPVTEKRNFLWEARSPTAKVYLLGSIHIATKDLYPLDKIIEGAFQKSDNLVVEVDINNITTGDQEFMLKQAIYTGQTTAQDVLSSGVFNLLQQELAKLSVPVASIIKFKPWYISIMIAQLELQRLGFFPNYGIDYYFLQKAKNRKQILELESFQEQIELFSGLSDSEQELNLYYTLISLDKLEKEMDELMQAWLRGDAQKMNFLLLESMRLADPRLSALFKRIFEERNKKMVLKIEQYLKETGSYFIIVGTGHLVGDNSIIGLLESKGYSVRQL